MSSTIVDQNTEKSKEKVQSEARAPGSRLAGLVTKAFIASPILLFGAASLLGLGFWATGLPILGTGAVWVAAAGALLDILAAFCIPGET